MNPPVIFYFWEPAGNMPAYLRLCRSTWDSGLPGFEKIRIDHSNLGDYVDPEVYDLDFLRRLTPAMQKDAIAIAVLEKYGGVFMDVDTIAVADISPVLRRLVRSEMVMFGRHCAFVAARPGARVLALWRQSIQQRLEFAAGAALEPMELPWDFTANAAFSDALDAIAGVGRPEPSTEPGRGQQRTITTRIRERVLLASLLRRKITMLKPQESGFIAEATISADAPEEPSDRYRRFWFESDIATASAFTPRTTVIGLHHSWTPDWYTALSTDEVLDHNCLLSRVLRHVINGQA